jgi:hypothetical protein
MTTGSSSRAYGSDRKKQRLKAVAVIQPMRNTRCLFISPSAASFNEEFCDHPLRIERNNRLLPLVRKIDAQESKRAQETITT